MSNRNVDLDEDLYSDELFDDVNDLLIDDMDDEDAEYVNQTSFFEEEISEELDEDSDYDYDNESLDDEEYQ